MLADLWSEVLGKSVGYLGETLDGPEMQMRQTHPAWFGYEPRQMLARFQSGGAVADEKGLADLEGLLGRAPRSYRDFAPETAYEWLSPSV